MASIFGDAAPAHFKDWKITAERELVVPERVKRQQAMAREEERRLKALGMELGAGEVGERLEVGQAPPGLEGRVGEVGA